MAHGLPDFSRKVIIEYTGGFIGLEELATRLGFIAPFDLRGNLVLMDDFETEVTEYELTSTAVSPDPVRTSRRKWSGNWSMKLVPATGVLERCYMQRFFPYLGAIKYGYFTRVLWDEDAKDIRWRIFFQTGSREQYMIIWYNRQTEVLRAQTGPAAFVTIADNLVLGDTDPHWVETLITFDMNTLMYDKIIIANREYDISHIPIWDAANVDVPSMWVGFEARVENTTTFTCYLDDIVLVKNVP